MQKIAAALLKAKQSFGPALKDKTNPAFKSKYADLGACLEAVDKPCLDNAIVLYQETSEDPTGVTVETVFLHDSGESLRCGKLHVPASKQDPQGYGSALTYARRYSLMTACGIAPEDDDGNAASNKTTAKPAAAKPAVKPEPAPDMSAKSRAARIMVGVAAGDAVGAAKALAGLEQELRDEIWSFIDEAAQKKLTAAWPKELA